MLQRLRHRAQGQEGFTLIELLVVILIIGILAAVAIPAFLSQKGKAYDANVKSDINSAQTAEETYNTSNGNYIGASGTTPGNGTGQNPLLLVEPTLSQALTAITAAPPGDGMTVTANGTTGYTIVATNAHSTGTTKTAYTLVNAGGVVTRTCAPTGQDGCPISGNW